nr:acyl-CoA dehydrogenase family protein [Gemmatimonadaceae bacterium]
MTVVAPPVGRANSAPDLALAIARVAREVAAVHADDVDREACFPVDAIAALKRCGAMAALVPRALGGPGATIDEVVAHCTELGRACASTAMIYAMHQIEVAVLVRHAAEQPLLRDYLCDLVDHQWLIASATSEIGIGGDLRRSACALDRRGGRVCVTKQASVMSYGDHADAILLTARRHADAAASDQVLLLARREDCTLTPLSDWNALGFRGTGSRGFTVVVDTPAEYVLET